MIDSHCHLGFDELKVPAETIIHEAALAGVTGILTVACHEEQLPDLIDIIEKYPTVWGAFGLHPEEADKQSISTDQLIRITKHPKIIGIGETGIDLYYNPDTLAEQKANFEKHIAACIETGLPLIVHARNADHEIIDMVSAFKNELTGRGVIHCFSSSWELAKNALDWGFCISASGIMTFKKSNELREMFQKIPLDRLLIETDAPYLAPEPHRGKMNTPAFVPFVLQKLAELKNVSVTDLDQITTQNFYQLYKKAAS